MSKDWKENRTEAAIKEGTDKIMKAAQKLSEKEETLFPEKLDRAKKILSETELPVVPIVNVDDLKKTIESRLNLVSDDRELNFNQKLFNDGYVSALNFILNKL